MTTRCGIRHFLPTWHNSELLIIYEILCQFSSLKTPPKLMYFSVLHNLPFFSYILYNNIFIGKQKKLFVFIHIHMVSLCTSYQRSSIISFLSHVKTVLFNKNDFPMLSLDIIPYLHGALVTLFNVSKNISETKFFLIIHCFLEVFLESKSQLKLLVYLLPLTYLC